MTDKLNKNNLTKAQQNLKQKGKNFLEDPTDQENVARFEFYLDI
jgi:hypothetical protein